MTPTLNPPAGLCETLDRLEWVRNTNPRVNAAGFYTLGRFHPRTIAFFTRNEMREGIARAMANPEDFAPLLRLDAQRRRVRFLYRLAAAIVLATLFFVIGSLSGCCEKCREGVCPHPQMVLTVAPEKVWGFQIFDTDRRLIRAEGCDTGVWVFNPCDGERLFIPPGAVAVWEHPVTPPPCTDDDA